MARRDLRRPKLNSDNCQMLSSCNKCKWIKKYAHSSYTRKKVGMRCLLLIKRRSSLHGLLHQCINEPKRRRLTQCINGQQGQRFLFHFLYNWSNNVAECVIIVRKPLWTDVGPFSVLYLSLLSKYVYFR